MTDLSLAIPSVRRPETLTIALRSVREHGSDISEVLVVAREDDLETHRVASAFNAKVVPVGKPGLAWAMRQGALHASSDVVAFIDDDATIRAGWSARLLSYYSDAEVGGVGGRDQIHLPLDDKAVRQAGIGTVSPRGRVLGGHHLGSGEHREVDHLKGVNCSFRREVLVAVDFQELVAGAGAQARNEFVASILVAALGYKLIYDPRLVVDHYPAERASDDTRNGNLGKTYEAAFNERLGFELSGDRRGLVNLLFLSLIGYPHTPGIGRLARGASVKEVRTVFSAIAAARRTAAAHDVLGDARSLLGRS